jgi:hypothetical protein
LFFQGAPGYALIVEIHSLQFAGFGDTGDQDDAGFSVGELRGEKSRQLVEGDVQVWSGLPTFPSVGTATQAQGSPAMTGGESGKDGFLIVEEDGARVAEVLVGFVDVLGDDGVKRGLIAEAENWNRVVSWRSVLILGATFWTGQEQKEWGEQRECGELNGLAGGYHFPEILEQ